MGDQPDAAKTPVSLDAIPMKVPGISEYEVEEEVVLYDPRKDSAHVLNPAAAVCWWLIDGEHKIDDIIRELAELYDAEIQKSQSDVQEILEGFELSHLITYENTPEDNGQ